MRFSRRATTQDVSWFLDQDRQTRLDLSPPYQRKSVWTPADRRFFLDTIFKDFPCPPIYLHKSIDESGAAIYHVIDGKQRIETVLNFAKTSKLRIPSDFGDERLANKRWKDIFSEPDLRNRFLNYSFVVEMFDDLDENLVNDIFTRMNKNSRKLTPQELRNARFDGWFSKQVDAEVEHAIWKEVKIVTTGRARRMADKQFIAELLMVIIHDAMVGFDQALIDEVYAEYDDIESPDLVFDQEGFKEAQSLTRRRLVAMNEHNHSVSAHASTSANMYTLWSLLVLKRNQLPDIQVLATHYKQFMEQVEELTARAKRPGDVPGEEGFGPQVVGDRHPGEVVEYFQNNQSATTELPQRSSRLDALARAVLR